MEIELTVTVGGFGNSRTIGYARDNNPHSYKVPSDDEIDQAMQQLDLATKYVRSQLDAMRTPTAKAASKKAAWYAPPRSMDVDSGPVKLTLAEHDE